MNNLKLAMLVVLIPIGVLVADKEKLDRGSIHHISDLIVKHNPKQRADDGRDGLGRAFDVLFALDEANSGQAS